MKTENFNEKEHPIEIKKINEKIYIVGLCWENKTDKHTKMNNINDVIAYLKKIFANKFFLARFSNKIDGHFKYENYKNGVNDLSFVDLKAKFNSSNKKNNSEKLIKRTNITKDGYFSQIFQHSSKIEDIFYFCKLSSGWLFDDNVIIIENRNKKYCNLYLQSLLYYLKMNPVEINESKRVLKDLKITTSDFTRNIEEFRIITKKGNFEKLKIFQIIISNINLKGDIYFKINNFRSGKIELSDFYYTIAKFDTMLDGETRIEIFQNDNLLLKIEFNSYAYEEGLYRFNKDDFSYLKDLISKYSKGYLNDLKTESEIIVDVVLLKVGIMKNIYESKSNIQMLIDDFDNEIDPLKLKNLLSAGYDPNYSKIALMIHRDQADAKKFLENKSGDHIDRNYLTQFKTETLKKSIENIANKPEDTDFHKNDSEFNSCLSEKPFKVKYDQRESLATLELLPESIEFKREIQKKRMPVFRKINSKNIQPKKSLLAKPFHWTTSVIFPGSIFAEMGEEKTEINFELFERWFCSAKKQNEPSVHKQLSSINDQKRLFLVSLSLKNLEKRTLETSRDFMKLSLEDLKLAQIIVPKNEEMTLFGQNLSAIDEKMIKFKKFEILINVLIFERRFITNFSTLENSFNLIEKAILALNNSKMIVKLFKTILDLGNCINYTYGTKPREFTAFKLSTLNVIQQYKSQYKGYTLISFLALTLRKDPEFKQIFKELNPIYLAKNHDLSIVRERINEFIELYEKYKPLINSIDQCVYDDINSFFCYFYITLKRFSERYLTLLKAINDFKKRFNEDEKVKINEIFKIFSDFLFLLEGEFL
ncbi:Formin-like protein 7 [Dictyocoela muelleri]|nr:Formin-like protein 7 [Dictyocoela muelleri]